MELVLSSSSEHKNLFISLPEGLYILPHNISVRNFFFPRIRTEC